MKMVIMTVNAKEKDKIFLLKRKQMRMQNQKILFLSVKSG